MRGTTEYTDEFRAEAVALYRGGTRTKREVCRDLGINFWTFSSWLSRDTMKRKKPTVRTATAQTDETTTAQAGETPAEKIRRLEREVAKLQREKAQLEMDRAILKKAAAFFAKESE
jgi:transposase